ncbi:A-kinase anchor protein 6 isoform X1 [Empidonax traillii]|uniref:A-kinase anchor protein 6 isoform X1 n=1 Tax=Empidonax traillii TaxID=164674 RepID=UPI000FFD1350|nr:A-kinase anchor protein 6 isoform X1 [Empidonax traillii]XP_027734584.1 A-kinase anchor protein 6 isoform X1 [Empidonax traillii]XP_027734585.1 A-kinase anchor protein 6 isoform X1 [Empidonax traillii]XP_027734586.1 A-kinase anchor protein 6 isoform X1 [Empidonax traillii]XP_027734587.1 A-kinase anchor protein 6 isoform X1 [Empidonax traillii]XP_027734588.1 A-kinase anchor protein 6 isoform X1 [Empidonax traillii]XP_027734589.1 A-kinase anchor protein 6 isoform X1 [Empidonax traillii]XP_0
MLAMDVALSPMRTQELDPMPSDASPMLINMTPTVEQGGEEDAMKDLDSGQQYEKPPPLHTGADWKIVLHLPEIETWLRMTSERVRDLTYSVQQDSDSKHVDVHLVQLKDICEDISDHVEQIHALLETEFSLKLLSYSVNVIVDIHTVQLLWHQLRVSVLVLRERILQGLQDANGNYTRQTDILQAFSEETKEDRLDSLTEVDDSGQLTIKCSQNYLSLDCGITAFELSDYSPSEDLLGALDDMTSSQGKAKSFESWNYSEMDKEFPGLIRSVGLLAVATDSIASQCNEALKEKEIHVPLSAEDGDKSKDKKASHDLSPTSPSANSSLSKEPCSENVILPTESKPVSTSKNPECSLPQHTGEKIKHSHCETSTPKRSIRDCFNYNEDSPTQPTLPKRGLFLKDDVFKDYMEANDLKRQISQIVKNEMSRSTPSLLDPPDRSKLCLALQSPYSNSPSAVSQSYDCLNTISDRNLDYTINNHFKDSPIILGKPIFYTCKEKPKHKKCHDASEKVKAGRTPGSICKTAPSTQDKKGGCSLQNGITPHNSQSLEETETDSSASSDACNQKDPNGQSQGKTEPFSSPTHSQKSASSAGSELSNSSPLLLTRKKNKSLSSTPPYTQKINKDSEMWYGSDEYLALPSHLKQTEVLALKLENLTKLLPQKPRRETIQNIDDWELSEMNSDSEMYPTYQTKKHKKRGRISPSSSSDIVSSLGDSIESGPLSDILSDEDLCMPVSCIKKYIEEKSERTAVTQPTGNETSASNKSALIHQLMQDIQHQENYETIWEKIEGFVSKLDEFIHWLNEAMETTENWTPPKAETDSLKLYLETHLSFKLNVDSHSALKEAVVEEGRQLLELIVSHKSEGLKDMLQMIASQWKELQKQIKRQHSWILRALDIIKAEILATDVSVENEEGTGSPKAEVQLCYLEAQRDAVEQMSLKLYSEQYNSSSKRKEEFADMSKVHTVGSNGLLDFDSEYQELWDWLIDMESIVMDSHDLMMSEEQQQHLYKRYNVEMSIRHPKKMELLSKVEALKKSGVLLPNDLLEKVDSINEKWELLGKTLGEKIQDTMVGHSGLGPRDLLSPESGSLVRQLEVRIKELKGWLRDTELFIFNSCLRQENEGTMNAEKQLQYFKSLCCEIKQRRRGVASVLRLCQHLLDDQETCNLNADHQSMQLIIVNLERRWEAIVMQAVQWQTRLQKRLEKDSEPLNVIDPSLMDLNGPSEDALEWDETDISNKLISIHEDLSDPDQELKKDDLNQKPASGECGDNDVNEDESISNRGSPLYCSNISSPPNPHIYQVYSLHNIELSEKNHMPFLKKTSRLSSVTQSNILNKSLSKDSSFSSTKSLPDLIGGTTMTKPYNYIYQSGNISRHSESESGIVSECDTETTNNSEIFLLNDIESTQSNPEIGHVESQVDDVINQKIKQDEEDHASLSDNFQLAPSACCGIENGEDLNSITMSNPVSLEELQGKHDVFTFYDYSYLQGSKFKLPAIMKQSQIEKTHTEGSLFHDICFDKIPSNSEHKSVESQPDGFIHDHTLATICGESDPNCCKSGETVRKLTITDNTRLVSTLSQSSSLESLSVVGDLFSSGIFKSGDGLQRSTSLESWLTSYKSNEDLFSHHGSGDISASSDSVGELSKRTLDLLNRLENIQSPSDQKIKRSISDITLQSSSQKMSFTGQLSLDIASSINEDSAASLTELSSSEDLSLCSEDIVLHRNKIPDSNASFRKHLNRSVADESDVNVSMIVNVSCTSACTDDEDDSDLLSSSTLTLTEEELGIKDEDDDSSIATDEDIYEECNLISGLDYIKNELQTWIRPKFSLTREKRKSNLSDEIQHSKEVSNETSKATDTLSIETLLNGSVQKMSENNGNSKNIPCDHEKGIKSHPMKDISQVVKDQLVDDMENGNVENTLDSQKEGVKIAATPKTHATLDVREAENEGCVCEAFTDSSDDSHMDSKETVLSSAGFRNPPRECQSHLQPDHHSVASSPAKKPCLESSSEISSAGVQDTALQASLSNGQQHRISTTEKFADCCAALKSSEAECNSSANGLDLCCNCESADFDKKPMEDGSVHNFVKEIIDMASTALKSKSQPECESSAPASLAQIKEKVLEHSHRPIQLRKGDFYSYLSLSSHDSDCGEVIKYIEEKSSTPVPLDFTDERENIECFFEACPEEEWVEQQQSISNGSPEAQVEQQQPISNPISETSAEALGEVTPESLEVKTSSEGRDLSFLCGNDNNINVPNPNKHSASNNLKNADDDLLISDGQTERLENNSPELSTKKSSTRKSPGTEEHKGCVAASEEASAIASQIKPGHSQKKDVLHQNRKTLTCEENLLKLHKERHINMHR